LDTKKPADPQWLGTVAGTASCFLCRRAYILIVQIWLKYCIWPSVSQTWVQLDKEGISIVHCVASNKIGHDNFSKLYKFELKQTSYLFTCNIIIKIM